ncbi:aminotransferase class V-fold PLP-dependent enzyme [Haloimpatiens sp. FM7315]|uniref:aminotransferase class V-fold PLP-dependent enzyme n=1 Tax=Haloimpatiens sp. FM7315 TaxID=3298609 RepID=UPI0035A2D518
MYNILDLRHFILGVDTKVPLKNGYMTTQINFDNAATTPPFISVMKKINEFAPWYSSIHRGTGYKSKFSTQIYEFCRKVVAQFVNADLQTQDVIFVKNTTEAINKLSYLLKNDDNKDIILCSAMEHHSNDLPWRDKFTVIYIDLDKNGRISLTDFEDKLKKYEGRIKLVTVTGASNVTGYVNPIYEMAELTHKYGSKILIDGAQLIPHRGLDMNPSSINCNIDFLAFSAHKMYAPFGAGVLIGPKALFKNTISEQTGGGTVKIVTPNKVIWDESPENQEAGTPNLIGVIALCEAINTLNLIGMKKIDSYENSLKKYTIEKMSLIKDIEIYSKLDNLNPGVGIIPFNIKGIPHEVTASLLSDYFGIAVRNGCFCAHPYVERLLDVSEDELEKMIKNPSANKRGIVRISFGLYNNYREIDVLVNALNYIIKTK